MGEATYPRAVAAGIFAVSYGQPPAQNRGCCRI